MNKQSRNHTWMCEYACVRMEAKMIVPVGESFNLERAVCNHGFFMMAPNLWIPSQKSLTRPLRLTNGKSVTVSITQPPKESFILITLQLQPRQRLPLSPQDRQAIRDQVVRMLRISSKDEMMVKEFHRVHPEAKKVGFARIFRSPTLFEDVVKSVLLCCCTWPRSLDMAEALCDVQRKLSNGTIKCCGNKGSKRKRSGDAKDGCSTDKPKSQGTGNFPDPKEIARLDEETLNQHCKLGYRASIILRVARDIENGNLSLGDFEGSDNDFELVHRRLRKIKGFGPFTVANIMMCVGFYGEIPVDTETIRHLEEVHGKTKLNRKTLAETVAEIYDKYAPFQCLAYWMEHVEYYEKRLGKLSQLPHSQYCNVSTTNFEIQDLEN